MSEQIINGETSYVELAKYYDQQVQNDNQRLDFLHKEKENVHRCMNLDS